jgi:hypothetical protein
MMTTAAVEPGGVIRILNMEELPFRPVFKPNIDWMDFKRQLTEKELLIPRTFSEEIQDLARQDKIGPWWDKKRNTWRPASTHKRVYRKGRRIMTMAALDKWLAAGGWIFWGNQKRAVHPGWIMSWQYQMVRNSVTGRGIWKAVKL